MHPNPAAASSCFPGPGPHLQPTNELSTDPFLRSFFPCAHSAEPCAQQPEAQASPRIRSLKGPCGTQSATQRPSTISSGPTPPPPPLRIPSLRARACAPALRSCVGMQQNIPRYSIASSTAHATGAHPSRLFRPLLAPHTAAIAVPTGALLGLARGARGCAASSSSPASSSSSAALRWRRRKRPRRGNRSAEAPANQCTQRQLRHRCAGE